MEGPRLIDICIEPAPVAQLDRAAPFEGEGCRFKSYRAHGLTGRGSAWLERLPWAQEVVGSNPAAPIKMFVRGPIGKTNIFT